MATEWLLIVRGPVLGASQQDVAADRSVRTGEKLPVGIVEGERDIGLRAGVHERGGSGDVPAERGDAVEIVKRHAKFGLALVADFHRGAVLAQVSALERDEEGVQWVFIQFNRRCTQMVADLEALSFRRFAREAVW
jgi:hypothetical protein